MYRDYPSNQCNQTEARRKIVWFLFVQWIIVFIHVVVYEEHNQNMCGSMDKVGPAKTINL